MWRECSGANSGEWTGVQTSGRHVGKEEDGIKGVHSLETASVAPPPFLRASPRPCVWPSVAGGRRCLMCCRNSVLSLSLALSPASIPFTVCIYLAASTQREPCSSSEPAECWKPFGSAQPATHPGNVTSDTSDALLRLLESSRV